jgi:hypothetical protein
MTNEPSPAVVPAAEERIEFFATHIEQFVQTTEFVRVTFCGGVRAVSIILTPTCFRAMSRQIVEGPPPKMH